MLGRFLVFLGGCLVVALFAALLAPFFVNWTDFRSNFELQAGRILGKKVTVHGGVDARILPFPSVTLHDVTVGSDENGEPLVHVARFSMDAELAPFLSGEARIFDMRIEEPKVRLKLLQNGKLDWLRGSEGDIPARTVVLENVHVSDGAVEFIDDQTGRARKLTGLNADMSARSLAGPWSVDGEAVLDGEAGSFHLSTLQPNEQTGAVPVKTRLTPKDRPFEIELDGDLVIKEGRPGYEGRFDAVWRTAEKTDEQEAAVRAPRVKGDFQLNNERIRVPSYRLELGDATNPYAVIGEATLDTGKAPEFLLTAEGQQIDVSRIGNVGAKGKTGRDPAVSVRQRIMSLIDMAGHIPVPNVPGRATLSLPAIVAGDTVIRDIRLDVRPAGTGWTIDNAVAILPGRTQVEAKGRLLFGEEPSFIGDMLVASTQPSGLATWVSGDVDPAIRKLKSIGFSALVNLTPELQRFEKLELAIGPAILQGRIERQSFAKSVPNLSFDLAGNAFDLDAVTAVSSLIAGGESEDSIFNHQVAARLKAGKFSAFGVDAFDVDTVFTMAEGVVSLEKLDIRDIGGAAINAVGRAEGMFPEFSGNGTLSFVAADPGPFLSILKQHLPRHPLLDRLAENAYWYSDSDLSAKIAFGQSVGGGIDMSLGGTANGSRVDVRYRRDDLLDFAGTAAAHLEATLENADTSILFGQAGLRPLPLPADENGRLALSLDEAAGGPAEAKLTFTTDQTAMSASGAIETGAEGFLNGSGKISIDSADLGSYLIMNGIALPQALGGLPVKGSADIAIDNGRLMASNIDLVAAGNAIKGNVTLEDPAGGMKAEGQLKLDNVDLPWLAENMLGPITDPLTADLSTGPLPAIVPRGAEISVQIEAATFTPGVGEALKDFTAALSYKDGILSLDDAKAQWLGGNLGGRLMVANNAGNGFFELRLDLADGAVARVLADDPDAAPATGAFNLTLVAESSGQSVEELLSSVNGSGSARISGLSVKRFDLGLFDSLLAEVDALEGDITAEKVAPVLEGLLAHSESALGDVAIPFNITDGLVRIQNVTAASERAQLSADARIDLRGRQIDASATVALDAGEEALTGADPNFKVAFAGDLSSPVRKIDASDLSNYLSLRAFERERRRVETLQSNVLEKQRLRREVSLYKYNEAQRELAREKAQALEQALMAEEQRLRSAAAVRRDAALEQQEALRRAQEAIRLNSAPAAGAADAGAGAAASTLVTDPQITQSVPKPRAMPVPAREKVTRGVILPPVGLRFEGLPGVN